jgi:hypothetical protein
VQAVETRPRINRELIKKVQKKFPETLGMKDAVFIEWALRKLLQIGGA